MGHTTNVGDMHFGLVAGDIGMVGVVGDMDTPGACGDSHNVPFIGDSDSPGIGPGHTDG